MTSEVNSKRIVDISIKKQRLCFFRNEEEEMESCPGEVWETSVPIGDVGPHAGHFLFRWRRIPRFKTKAWGQVPSRLLP